MTLSFDFTARVSQSLSSPPVRVLNLDTYYGSFLQQHYAQRPGLTRQSYEEQLGSLLDCRFSKSDAYSRAFRCLGHTAWEIVLNCIPLQLAWAREHGVVPLHRGFDRIVPRRRFTRLVRQLIFQRIAQAQIEKLDPDVLYFHNLSFPALRLLDWASRRGCFVAGQIASKAPSRKRLRRFDLLFTSFPHFVERFRSLGVDTEYLALGFDPFVLEALTGRGVGTEPDAERPFGVSFVGGIDPRWEHRGRTAFLEQICRRVDVDVWGYGAEALPSDSPVLRRYHGEAWGLDMYEALARSRITINRHVNAAEGRANNMRLFEATGVGALLLTEASTNLAEMFEPGVEVIPYVDLDDLIDKIAHFLERDEERRAVAAAGQARTLREHLYERRIEQIATALERRLRRGRAAGRR